MSNLSDLEELLKERKDNYYASTYEIFELLAPSLLEGVVAFYDIASLANAGGVVWEDIVMKNYVVYVTGIVKPPIGHKVTTETGRVVEITENIRDRFSYKIAAGVPADIACNGSAEDVVQFLVEAKKIADAEQEKHKQTLAELNQEASKTSDDFDLDQLTEEQRTSLELFYKGNP